MAMFLTPGLVLGTGEDTAIPDLLGPEGLMPERIHSQIIYLSVKAENRVYIVKCCGFTERGMTNSAGSGKVVGASFKSSDSNSKEPVT